MKKLTNKEITQILNALIKDMNDVKNMISVFISYINMNKHDKKLKKYLKDQNNLAKKKEKA
tara:strand:- start:2172 stop:2354 length:183 start_codon:yes stop_codon:yes gene_type:complete